jgi:flagellar hook assembly protein FlgD
MDFILHQNYPNPFNNTTVISFDVNNRTRIDVNVYDAEGRLVENIFSGIANRGRNRINWTAKSHLPSGVYFISINSDRQKKTGKIVYVK